MVRLFDDYSALAGEDVPPDEAERAVRHFIQRTERGMKIPPELQAFILGGLRRQLREGSGGWTGRSVGRPSKAGDPDANTLRMWAWYCYNLDPQFERLPKSEGGNSAGLPELAETVAEHMRKELREGAEAFAKQRPDVSWRPPSVSARSVRRWATEFAESGFTHIPKSEGTDAVTAQRRQAHADTRNLEKARLFCGLWLGLSDGEEALAPPTGEPVDILASWARQADHPRPAPAPSPAEIKAREIVAFWKGRK